MRTASAAELRADLVSPAALAQAIGCPVAADWPMKHWEPGPINWILAKLEAQPDELFWRSWYVQLNPGQPGGPLVIGGVGVKGPPDDQGVAEIGYGIVNSHWRRGHGSEAAGLLIDWIRSTGRVRTLRAHTLAGDPASGGVLRRNGFRQVATLTDPDDGEVDRFERAL